MFGGLKDRLRRKNYDNDVEDIRSNVLGDFRGLPPTPEPDFPRPASTTWDDPTSPPPRYNEPRFDEPPGFGSIDTRFPAQSQGQFDRDRYDIMDRLNLIESQLAAIRSQTETINERLKNLERSLVRRY